MAFERLNWESAAFAGMAAGAAVVPVVGAMVGYKVAEAAITTQGDLAVAQHAITTAETEYLGVASPGACEGNVLVTLQETHGDFTDHLSENAVRDAFSAACGSDGLTSQVMEKMAIVHDAKKDYWNQETRANSNTWFKFWGVSWTSEECTRLHFRQKLLTRHQIAGRYNASCPDERKVLKYRE